MWARHEALLRRRVVPTVPALVVSQAWRGGPRQTRLAQLLLGCTVETYDDLLARRVGVIVGKAKTNDVIDAAVVEGALRRGDVVVTSDPGDIGHIADALNKSLVLERPD